MEALYVLLIFSVLLGGGFLAAFFWAQKNGQFEDTQTPAMRILFDEADAKRQREGQSHLLRKKQISGEYHGS
ncbi:MAG TPA: cbb3-type cytochrome oxidase assembly protein CcoS [Turneriella sp.]|nr:cbb3-type cytochrome oxidase assembly protein CcoS [Turneriella sp.]